MRHVAFAISGLLLAYAAFSVGITTGALLASPRACGSALTFGDGLTFAVAALMFWPLTLAIGRFGMAEDE